MSRLAWILAGVALALWVGSYFLFFKRDLVRWLKTRPKRRAEAQKAAQAAAEARTRHLDELASKYPLPGTPNPPAN